MKDFVRKIFLLNSTYNRDKIRSIFVRSLEYYHITEFALVSDMIKHCTSVYIPNGTDITIHCGYYDVDFRYNASESTITEEYLKILIVNFIIAIENSVIYHDLIEKVSFQGKKQYLVFNDLITDITEQIKKYERDENESFCVMKISLNDVIKGEKFDIKFKGYIDIVRNSVKEYDRIYCDNKNIYVLLYKLTIEDGLNIVKRLNDRMQNIDIGIAQWQSSMVVVDLLGEIDNFIFTEKIKKEENSQSIAINLNKILDKAIWKKDNIIIVKKEDIKEEHKEYIRYEFKLNSRSFIVLKNLKPELDTFIYKYVFNYEDIALDVFDKLK